MFKFLIFQEILEGIANCGKNNYTSYVLWFILMYLPVLIKDPVTSVIKVHVYINLLIWTMI